jgi:Holliday junction resolvase
MNSKQKGKRGELEFVHYLQAKGYEARRGQQFCGSPDSPDVISNFPFHIEVKRVEKLNISNAMEQAAADCGNQTPIVAHRRNGEDWFITMKADDFLKALKI